MRMGIQYKVSAFLVAVLAAAFLVSTSFLTARSLSAMGAMATSSQEALRKSVRESARQVFASFERGTLRSMARGEMDEFAALIRDLANVPGVVEIGLTDAKGSIAYSSREGGAGAVLPAMALDGATAAGDKGHEVETTDAMVLAQAHRFEKACLSCHAAQEGSLAGVFFARYSLEALRQAEAGAAAQLGAARRSSTVAGTLTGLAGLVLAALGTFVMLGRLVRRPLAQLISAAERVSRDGDLTSEINTAGNDEVADLARAFAGMLKRLRELTLEIQQAAAALGATVAQMARVTQLQQQAVTRQAAAIQEAQVTAAEIRQTSQTAAKKAEDVLGLGTRAEEAGRVGESAIEQNLGGLSEIQTRVGDLATSIGALGESTRQVRRITETVKDLGDQTNLLALNAGLQAVHAGEHGRAFAVVARQMRALADQSVEATGKVRGILDELSKAIQGVVAGTEESARSMQTSLERTRESGEVLRELSMSVREFSAAVRQISAAVAQQNAGITQIFAAVTDLSAIMNDTVRRIEETSEATTGVAGIVERMGSLVRSYRV